MATATYPTNRMEASASVRYMNDGTVIVRSGTQDIGTGTYTTMAQVAADELGVPMERVRTVLGDSRLPPAPVSGGSMTTASVLPAVRDAAAQVREKLLAMAGANTGAGANGGGTDATGGAKLENGMVSLAGETLKTRVGRSRSRT